jgi:site-specific recombinase XerD
MTPDLSLADALALYQAEHLRARNFAPETRRKYSEDLRGLLAHLTEQLGLRAVAEVDRHHLENFLAALDHQGLKGTSRRRKVASIKSFFAFLASRGCISRSPALELVPPERERDRPRVLTQDEYERLKDAVRFDTRDAALIELLLQTGGRLSEIAQLALGDVTLPAKITKDAGNVGFVHIHGKGRKERTVTLNWKACKAVKAYLAVRPKVDDPHLFITKFGLGIGPRSIENVVAKYLKEAGIAEASVHTLRHTFATQHVKRGTKLDVVRQMLGHESLATTSIYIDLAREVMDKEIQQNAL